MAEAVARDPGRAPPLLVWTLAAFHVALLVAVAVGLLFSAGLLGNQLAALDTWVGVVAYLYLWAVTWWTNRRMLDDLDVVSLVEAGDRLDVVLRATKWGGVAGLLVFVPVFALAVVLFVAAGGIEAIPILLVGGVVGVAVSIGVGVVVGAVLALVDLALAGAVRVWLPGAAADPGPVDAGSRTDTP